MIINKKNEKLRGGNFARGKRAVTIDDRSGFKKPYDEMVFEPGTNYWVHQDESDKSFSMVSHPQNYGPRKVIEKVGLKYPSFDTFLSVGTPVCIADLFKNGLYPTSAGAVSVGSGTSGAIVVSTEFGLLFDDPLNSQYYIIVFQGI